MKHTDTQTIPRGPRVHLTLILIVTLGIALILPWQTFLPNVPSWTALLFHSLAKLGEALIVAGVLAAIVDESVKRNLVRDVTRDAAPYIVAYLFPDELKREIQEMLRVPFVRTDFELDLKLELRNGANGERLVRALYEVQYNVKNLTPHSIEYEHYLFQEDDAFAEPPEESSRFLLAGSSNAYPSYNLMEQDLNAFVASANGTTEFRRRVSIPVGGNAKFWHAYVTFFREDDKDYAWFVYPTIGTRIRIVADPSLTIDVAMHGKRDVLTHPPRNPKSWEHRGVFLAGQMIRIRWRKAPKATIPAQEDAAQRIV